MATLYITEYVKLPHGFSGGVGQMPEEPPIAEQVVPIGAVSTQSNPFNAATRAIRLHCDAICSVLIGSNPTATTNSGRMPANQTEYRSVVAGQGNRIAVIQNS